MNHHRRKYHLQQHTLQQQVHGSSVMQTQGASTNERQQNTGESSRAQPSPTWQPRQPPRQYAPIVPQLPSLHDVDLDLSDFEDQQVQEQTANQVEQTWRPRLRAPSQLSAIAEHHEPFEQVQEQQQRMPERRMSDRYFWGGQSDAHMDRADVDMIMEEPEINDRPYQLSSSAQDCMTRMRFRPSMTGTSPQFSNFQPAHLLDRSFQEINRNSRRPFIEQPVIQPDEDGYDNMIAEVQAEFGTTDGLSTAPPDNPVIDASWYQSQPTVSPHQLHQPTRFSPNPARKRAKTNTEFARDILAIATRHGRSTSDGNGDSTMTDVGFVSNTDARIDPRS